MAVRNQVKSCSLHHITVIELRVILVLRSNSDDKFCTEKSCFMSEP